MPLNLILIGLMGVAMASCAGPPTAPPPSPPPSGPHGEQPIASLRIAAPPSLMVNASVLLLVTALDAQGATIGAHAAPSFSSGDNTLARVSSSGVVTGLRRGAATITARIGAVQATVSLGIRAQVRIGPDFIQQDGGNHYNGNQYYLARDDTLKLSARFVDADGVTIDESPQVIWTSSNPAGASVSESGVVVGISQSSVEIFATSADGSDSRRVTVTDETGPPVTVRFAHTALDLGPVTFRLSKGGPVTLSFGESLERTILAGALIVQMEGFPPGEPTYQNFRNFNGMLRGGDRLSLFVVGGPTQAFLTPAWAEPGSVPGDSGRVRLVQGWNDFGVIYLRPTGAPKSGLPELCYFDPMNVSSYFAHGAGGFDIILERKYGTPGEAARLHATAPLGGSVTLVLTGDTPQTVRVLAFPDP